MWTVVIRDVDTMWRVVIRDVDAVVEVVLSAWAVGDRRCDGDGCAVDAADWYDSPDGIGHLLALAARPAGL
jgi:hypothetical protein